MAAEWLNRRAVRLLATLAACCFAVLPPASPQSTLAVIGSTLPSAVSGSPYSQTLTAQGGKAPYTWARLGTGLPTGLTLSVTGEITGTTNQIGTATFSVQVTDAAGTTAVGSFTLNVAPMPLSFTTTQLPAGVVNVEYPAQVLKPAGGTAPYTVALLFGTLPPGLTLVDGTLTGTPTSTGTYGFSLLVMDASGATVPASLSLLVKPTNADIVLSETSLRFNLLTGAATLPPATTVRTRSAQASQILRYTYTMLPAVPWLSVSGGATTPGSLVLTLTTAALTLTPGTYTASLQVTCAVSSPCAGDKDTVAITLSITTPAPRLAISSSLLPFTSAIGNPVPQAQTFNVANSGGGMIAVTSIVAPDLWVSLSGIPASLSASASVPVTVTLKPTGLKIGYYRSLIRITTSSGSATVTVGLLVAKDENLRVEPAGAQFETRAGSTPGNSAGTIRVAVLGNSTISWTASLKDAAPWLSLDSASGISGPGTPGQVKYSISNNATSLAPGVYYATIRITSNAPNSPIDFRIVLNVLPANTAAKATPQSSSLLFVTQPAGSPGPQQIQITTSSTNAEPYQASASVNDSGNWLSVSPAGGTMTRTVPGVSTVSVATAGLAAGVYHGFVHYAASSSVVRTVDVTLIVQSATSTASKGAAAPQVFRTVATTCQPTQLVPSQAGLVSGFSQAVSWPAVLALQLFDDCGNTVPNGQVTATFSNGDPPLAMPLAADKSAYSNTWIPRSTAQQVTVTATASAPGLASAQALISGQVVSSQTPALADGGVLHIFNPRTGIALSPGTVIQIYGSNFATQTGIPATTPLPTAINGTSVIIGGIPAPLYFASPGQINAEVPFELAPDNQYQIVISANNALTTPEPIIISSVSPGVAAYPTAYAIAQHSDGSLINAVSPARPGEVVVFYLAGLGATDNPVITGAPSPSNPLAHPQMAPSLTLNGNTIPTLFNGLTPTAVGLYQINFQIPATTPDGDMALVVTQNGVASNRTILSVRKK